MALDLTDAFTVGGLDLGRGNGVSILMLSGEIVGLDGTGTYAINADGTVTGSDGGADADVSLNFGAGQIVVTNYDADGTATGIEGAVAEIAFTFGTASATDQIEIIGCMANGGFDIAGGTVGSAAVDAIAPMGLQSISGNTVKFAVGAPYENEGGVQVSISDTTILKFSVIAFAKGGVLGQ